MRACPKCGTEHDRNHSYCAACHRASQKRYLSKNPIIPRQRKKDNARSYAGEMKRRGKLTPQPCRKCGDPKSEMHHHDYGRPVDVEWLCRRCHLAWHKFWLARIKDIFASWVLIDDQRVVPIVKRETRKKTEAA